MPRSAPVKLGTKTVGSARRAPYVDQTIQLVASERKGRMERLPVVLFSLIFFTVFSLQMKEGDVCVCVCLRVRERVIEKEIKE